MGASQRWDVYFTICEQCTRSSLRPPGRPWLLAKPHSWTVRSLLGHEPGDGRGRCLRSPGSSSQSAQGPSGLSPLPQFVFTEELPLRDLLAGSWAFCVLGVFQSEAGGGNGETQGLLGTGKGGPWDFFRASPPKGATWQNTPSTTNIAPLPMAVGHCLTNGLSRSLFWPGRAPDQANHVPQLAPKKGEGEGSKTTLLRSTAHLLLC